MPSYSDTHQVLRDHCNYRTTGDEDDEVVREMAFKPRPDFENSEMYSPTDHSKDTQPVANGLSNGSVKTQLSILVNNVNKKLNPIEEEAPSPASPKNGNTAILLAAKDGTHVNGVRELKRRSLLLLDGDLASESTDEGRNDEKNIATPENQDATDGPLETSKTKNPMRNHASIHISSPSRQSNHVEPMNNSEHIFNDGSMNHVHEVQVDIPLTPSIGSSASTISDDIPSLSSNSSRTSPVSISSAMLLTKRTSKDVLVNGDNSPTSNSEVSTQNFSNDESIEEDHICAINSDTIRTESPTEKMESNGTEAGDANRLEISTTTIINDNNHQSDNSPPAVKVNGDIKTSPFNQKRHRSSGFLSYNGDHQDIHIPECIILDDITSLVGQKTEDDKSNGNFNEQITSRTDACDNALKTFYSLKTKLDSLKHSNDFVRSKNEILRSKKQIMVQKIDVLVECNERIKDLTTPDEKSVVEAILNTKSSLSHLTEICTLLYNGQYSMKHFTSELVESIDKHIDVLITTDAWNTTPVSDLTIEIHKDKCELVHDSLQSLRKIVNKL